MKTLKDVADAFRNKAGNPEAESILVDAKADKDFVSIWTNRRDAEKLVRKNSEAIISWEIQGDGVQFFISRKFFRGILACVRPVRADASPEIKAARAANLAKGRLARSQKEGVGS